MHEGRCRSSDAEQLNVLGADVAPVDGLSHQEVLKAAEKPVLRIEVDPNSIFYDGFGDDIRSGA